MQHMEILKREQRKPAKTTLSQGKRQALLQIVNTQGYAVILELLEMECVLQDATLMGIDPADEKKVLAEHRVGIAKWELFAEIQRQIEHEVKELVNGAAEGPVMTDEEKEIAAILDPTAPQN
jgi:hypothetical protein